MSTLVEHSKLKVQRSSDNLHETMCDHPPPLWNVRRVGIYDSLHTITTFARSEGRGEGDRERDEGRGWKERV